MHVAMRPLLLVLAVLLFVVSAVTASPRPHPLDPLSATELATVHAAVLSTPSVPARPLHFHYVGLNEPGKKDVLSYAHGTSTTILLRLSSPQQAASPATSSLMSPMPPRPPSFPTPSTAAPASR